MYVAASLEDLNALWCSERVIHLLDMARMDDADAVAKEWGYKLEYEESP
jgi:hypothetical protein